MKIDRWNETCSRCEQAMHNKGRTWVDESRVCPACWDTLIRCIARMQVLVETLNLDKMQASHAAKNIIIDFREKKVYLEK